MPTARRSRTIAAPVEDLWALICDAHHLPRWWPRVTRVEDVTFTDTGESDAFTEVMRTRKGKLVRADFDVTVRDEATHTLTWSQRVEGTPFAAVLQSAETEIQLAPATGRDGQGTGRQSADGEGAGAPGVGAEATEVTIELRQRMAGSSAPRVGVFVGFSSRFGSPMVRRAAAATIDEALDGLERIGG